MNSFSPNDTYPSAGIGAADSKTRRSSTRSIKRRRFDDELVESSIKSDRSKASKSEQKLFNQPGPSVQSKSNSSLNFASPKADGLTLGSGSLLVTGSALSPGSDVVSSDSLAECEADLTKSEVRPAKSARGKYQAAKIKNKKPANNNKLHPAGRSKASTWKAQDDLLLIMAVQQTCDLNAVHLSVKFSRQFSPSEISERWYNLLYDPDVSRSATSAMRRLPMETVDCLMRRTPYSVDEEDLIKAVPRTPTPNLMTFEKLLEDNQGAFHQARTPSCLLRHWSIMKDYDLLVDNDDRNSKIPSFLKTLDKLTESDEVEDDLEEFERGLEDESGHGRLEMVKLEREVEELKRIITKEVVGITSIQFDESTYAILKGRVVQYFMRSTEMTFGRSTDDNKVDADLAEEGPAHKISRRHFFIRLEAQTKTTMTTTSRMEEEHHHHHHQPLRRFLLYNQAKRPVFVDGFAVQKGEKTGLEDGSVVEVSCIRLIFHVNEALLKMPASHGPATNGDERKKD